MNDNLEFIKHYIDNLNEAIETTTIEVVLESLIIARDHFECIMHDLEEYYKIKEGDKNAK